MDALKDFYSEREARARQFEQLQAAAEGKDATTPAGSGSDASAVQQHGGAPALKYPLSMDLFGEDWNESQFWVSTSSAHFCARLGLFSGHPGNDRRVFPRERAVVAVVVVVVIS